MGSKIGEIYTELLKEYRIINSTLKPEAAQDKFIVVWNGLKAKATDKDNLYQIASDLLKQYREKRTEKKVSTLHRFFSKGNSTERLSVGTKAGTSGTSIFFSEPGTSKSHTPSTDHGKPGDEPEISIVEGIQRKDGGDSPPIDTGRRKRPQPIESEDEEGVDDPQKRLVIEQKREKPAQERLKTTIAVLESQLNAALLARDSGINDDGNSVKLCRKLRKELENAKKKLQQKISKAEREKKYRADRKSSLQNILLKNPDISPRVLKIRETEGRPRVETDQPGLLQAIVDLAIVGGAADPRRRSEMIRTCRTLDDLREELEKMGFSISRTGCYMRLMPKNQKSSWGKRHVTTVPVKLTRAQTDAHKTSIDGKFCTATIRSVETLASILGKSQVMFMSWDDKARVPIGITAANKQAPFLMHLEYRVKLPDHDWVVAARHKLIPSVYAGIMINDGKIDGDGSLVSYSGPTYVAIRSGKHDSSSAASHAFDLETLIHLPEFKDITKENDAVKPVLVVSVDGGPDENPRYPRVIQHAIDIFKRHDLDAVFIFTNAPGRSAYNRVERRMAPLSRLLSGVILPHDSFGSHLDDQGKTIDEEKEIQNFEVAGKTLAEIWNGAEIDGHPVKAEYISPGSGSLDVTERVDDQWLSVHVRESQYFLQIVKCDDTTCCSALRSDLKAVLPDGFFPPPFIVRRSREGRLVVPEPEDVGPTDSFPPLLLRQGIALKPIGKGLPSALPYDSYCPSVQSALPDRVCSVCGLYFAAKKHKDDHAKSLHSIRGRPKQIRPKAILSKRGEEVLCMVDVSGLQEEEEEVLWLGLDEVDTEGLQVEMEETEPSWLFPTIDNFAHWLQQPWAEDEDQSLNH